MLRRFLVFLVAFSSLFAWAACTQYLVDVYGFPARPWAISEEAACSAINGASKAGSGDLVSTTISGARVTHPRVCTYTSTALYKNGQSTVGETTAIILYKTVEDCDTECGSKLGQEFTLNWTLGYTRTPNLDAAPSWEFIAPSLRPPPDGRVCDPVSSCQVALVQAPTAAWQSLSPTSEGLYRVSLDYDALHLGGTCTPTESEKAAAHPAADKPTCPGFVGEVNGVPGCYGTASNPTSNDVPESKPKPPEAGNPTAGKAPDSGEGSGTGGAGRTPSTGDGGPRGGPAAAAGSGTKPKPDDTTPKPDDGKEQANCGAPGQPKCGIDESGTPGKFEGDKAVLDKWKTDMDANRATIKDADGGFFDSYSVFFAAPPIVPCEAIELPNGQALTRQCDVVEGTRSVMSYIWALAAIWICLGWIREAI